MKKVVLVVGVKGVGKSSVIRGAIDENWEVINFGDIMMEILDKEGISRDELSWKLNSTEYIKLQEKAGRELIKRIKKSKKNIIIDSHAIIYNIFGFLPGFPLKILKNLPLSLIVFIWANPKDIAKRRERDIKKLGRKRKIMETKDIEKLQELERKACLVYSTIKGIPFHEIENPEGKIEKAIKEFKRVLEVI